LMFPDAFLQLIIMAGTGMTEVPQIQSSSLALIADACLEACPNSDTLERLRAVLIDAMDTVTDDPKNCPSCLDVVARLRKREGFTSNAELQAVFDVLEHLLKLKQKLGDERQDYAEKSDGGVVKNKEEKYAAQDRVICALHELHDFLCGIPRTEELRKQYLDLIAEAMTDERKNELGIALAELSTCYSWTDSSMKEVSRAIMPPPIPASLPEQPAWKVKEEISVAAAKALQTGNLHEDALVVLQDTTRFQEEQYDYLGASRTLRMGAEIAADLAKGNKIPRDYYHVGFYGSDLPPEIKNKDFIYPGRPLEKLMDFQERILVAYPKGEVLKKTDAPGPEYTDTPGLKLLITNAVVSSEKETETALEALEAEGGKKEEVIGKSHAGLNGCSTFVYSKPLRKKKMEPGENEFRGLYLQKQFFFTAEPLPNSRVRTEIVKRLEVISTPIQNACNMVLEKNEELRTLIKKYDEAPEGEAPNVQPLAMALNGCIMAAVNGGLTMYEEAFLTEQFRQEEPDEAPLQSKLLAGIDEQMNVLDHGLQVFERHCSPDMADLLSMLKGVFGDMRVTWANKSAKAAVVTGSSPAPTTPSSPPTTPTAAAAIPTDIPTNGGSIPQPQPAPTEGGAPPAFDGNAVAAPSVPNAISDIPPPPVTDEYLPPPNAGTM